MPQQQQAPAPPPGFIPLTDSSSTPPEGFVPLGRQIQVKKGGPVYNTVTNPPPGTPPEGTVTQIARGFLETSGLPTSISAVPGWVEGLTRSTGNANAPHSFGNVPLNIAKGIYEAGNEVYQRPGPQNKVLGSIPMVGPLVRGLTDKLEQGKYAQLVGGLGAVAAMGARPADIAEGITKTGEMVKGGTQTAMGVGPRLLEDAVKARNVEAVAAKLK